MDDGEGKLIMVNLLKEAVASESWNLAYVDFENIIIKVDGFDKVVGADARAVTEIMD